MHRTPPHRRAATLVALLLVPLLLAGCFRLERDTYAIGFEPARANLVVHRRQTDALHHLGRARGPRAARQVILAVTPRTFPVTTRQRLALCALSSALCLTAPQLGTTLVRWFRADIEHRSDFWPALSEAGTRHRCFAWTLLPRRNLTHKGLGTSGCAPGGR